MSIAIIKLIKGNASINTIGDPINIITEREITAEKQPVKRSEFYQGAAVGLKPEVVFEIWQFDYQDERKVIYNNREYRVIRTYEKANERIELTCTSIINEVSAYGNA